MILAGARGYFARIKVPGFSTFALGLMKYQHFHLGLHLGGSFSMLFRKWKSLKYDSNNKVFLRSGGPKRVSFLYDFYRFLNIEVFGNVNISCVL